MFLSNAAAEATKSLESHECFYIRDFDLVTFAPQGPVFTVLITSELDCFRAT